LLDWNRPYLTLGDLVVVNRIVCSSCLLHRSLLVKTGGFPEGPEFKAVEDYALWLRVAALTDFAFCTDALVRYRDDPQGSIRASQSILPEKQKALVLEATSRWIRNSDLGTARSVLALTRLLLAQGRLAVGVLGRRLRYGARR
jgi:hypothetical protein